MNANERRAAEQPFRWGRENGFLAVDGQKVPIERPRLRSEHGREQRLGSYELFRRSEPLDAAVWDKLLLGLSTRNYSQAVREFAASYGIEFKAPTSGCGAGSQCGRGEDGSWAATGSERGRNGSRWAVDGRPPVVWLLIGSPHCSSLLKQKDVCLFYSVTLGKGFFSSLLGALP